MASLDVKQLIIDIVAALAFCLFSRTLFSFPWWILVATLCMVGYKMIDFEPPK